MSFYHKGNPHKIAAMASKSCNAVSSRDLYVPLTATVTVNEQARTFSVEVIATCYFGTRINIQNTFSNMVLNGQNIEDKTINAWVSQDEPGKEIARTTFNGTFNYEGEPSIRNAMVHFTGKMTFYKDVGCTQTNEIVFQNEVSVPIANIDPYYTQPAVPTIDAVTSLDTALLVDVSTASFGEGGGRYLYVEASKTNDFEIVKTSTPISELHGTCRVSNLQMNTKYYIRAVCANNGLTSYGQTQEAYTLATNMMSDIYYASGLCATLTVMGANDNAVSTDIYVGFRSGGTGEISWNKRRTEEGIGVFKMTNLPVGVTTGYDEIYLKAITITSAGSFTSPIYSVQNPNDWSSNNKTYAYISSITSLSSTSVRVQAISKTTRPPYTIAVYYRPVGMEEEWVKAGDARKTSSGEASTNFTIAGLVPNYAEYEVIAVLTTEYEYQGEIIEYTSTEKRFFTIPTQVSNDTCDSLDYMVQLICQTYNAIKQGNITIYMNDDTKQWCEGEDGIPTLASIMSRINRYMHAVGCVLCSMDGFIELLKESEPNQVFMGQMGWVDCDDAPVEGSVYPVISDGVHAAIDELIRQVWHYMGDYDYFARNPLELNAQSGTATGQTAVMGDKVYTWNGSSWASARDIPHEDFGVIHINSGRYADHAFYWFVNDWNRLDADTDEIEARLEALESLKVVQSFDAGNYRVAIFADTGNATTNITQINQTIPTDVERDTIITITQPERQDETHLVVYDDGDGNPIP